MGILKAVVNDTGCGMSKAQINQLFHRFTQVSEDSHDRRKGMDIGLSICSKLIHKMNGEIKVFSHPGKGTCFMICIPMSSVGIPPPPET